MPPPPPPPGALPKVKAVQILGGRSPSDNRNALLSSIQKGTKLKKTVTVDKSGPLIPGKTSNVTSSVSATSSPSRVGGSNSQSQPNPRLGGGGALNFQDELANRLKKSSNSPTSTTSRSNEDRPREYATSTTSKSPITDSKSKQSNGRLPTSSSSGSLSREPTPNQSSLFNKNSNTGRTNTNFSQSKATLENLFGGGQSSAPSFSSSNSNSNISSINQQEQQQQSYVQSQPEPPQSVTRPNYHKPNLAPKPPGQNGNGNPVARHQSMRTPKSPPAALTAFNPTFTTESNSHMGTIRSNKPRHLVEAVNVRPRPPNKPPPPPPPTRQVPTIPTSQATNLNQPPSIAKSQNAINEFGRTPLTMRPVASVNDINDNENQAPPPPPHRMCPAPPVNLRTHPTQPTNDENPPRPPERKSSRRIIDLEAKFQFHSVMDFPQPKPFLNVTKHYPSRAMRATNGM